MLFFFIYNKFKATYNTGTALKVFDTINEKVDDSTRGIFVALENKFENPVFKIIKELHKTVAIKINSCFSLYL